MADAFDPSIGCTWTRPTPTVSQDFFDQLRTASERTRKAWTGLTSMSPYGKDGWAPAPNLPNGLPQPACGPVGAVIHYTASGEPKGTVRWFCDPLYNSKCSAHFVVCQGLEWPPGVLAGLPLVAKLPAAVIMCRDITQSAWHATWANAWAVGFELVNQGCETADSTDRPITSALGARVMAAGRRWQPYTPQQSAATAITIRYLRELCPAWRDDLVLGHENVQMVQTPDSGAHDKRDPGPLMDLYALVMAAAGHNRLFLNEQSKSGFPTDTERLLRRLRYNVGLRVPSLLDHPPSLPLLDTCLDQLRIFQYAAGLVPDGIAGPKTMAAINARIADREGT